MKLYLALLFAAMTFGQVPDRQADRNETPDANVNSRYTVESVGIANERLFHVSHSLMDEMQHLVGSRFNNDAFQHLAERISDEVHAHKVTFRLARGTDPDHIRVTFEVERPKGGFDVDIPKLVYHSREGWNAEAEAKATIGANRFIFGVVSDGDALVERFSGIKVRYERQPAGTDRLTLAFEFDSYHEQYQRATETAAFAEEDAAVLYRTRRNIEPSATLVLAGPLTWTVGVSFQEFEPLSPAAPTESANAVTNTLRFERRWEDSASGKHRIDAGYDLRAATNLLASDSVYTRHAFHARYRLKRARHFFDVSMLGGVILGHAPLFERFVLGTSTTLRGWNKFDLDPLGGSRAVHGSIGYGYRIFRAFYDAGSVWDRGMKTRGRQSGGFGVKLDGVLLAVAFPIRSERVDPVFIAGMNF